jgi:RNA polymerase sigma factor for flagellar operon FliA
MRPDNRELWRRYRKEGDVEARSKLLEQHLGLVHSCANRVARSVQGVVELDDLMSSGTLGLVRALESFDPARGVAFSTYAMRRIHGAILDELRSRDWMTRATRNRARQLAHVVSELESWLGRAPDQGEIARALGVTISDYWRFWAEVAPRRIVSLSTPSATAHDSPPLEETIAVCEEDPVKGVIADERRIQLTKALLSLPERDRQVLALNYYEGLNLRQIGEVLQVTESRVSQIRSRALRRLRDCAALVEATL